jgi:hypothetical protein
MDVNRSPHGYMPEPNAYLLPQSWNFHGGAHSGVAPEPAPCSTGKAALRPTGLRRDNEIPICLKEPQAGSFSLIP